MFIVFEGSNGTGTTTQSNIFKQKLSNLPINNRCEIARFPGSTELGKELRKILKFSTVKITPEQELLLFASDAVSFYQNILTSSSYRYDWMICDRINLVGMLTYQLAGGASIDKVISTIEYMKTLCWNIPIDILFVFTAPYDILKSRISKPNIVDLDKNFGDKKDRFESRGDDYMLKVNENYESVANGNLGQILYDNDIVKKIIEIDASKSINEVTDAIDLHLHHC
jgi:thymidylate kinase